MDDRKFGTFINFVNMYPTLEFARATFRRFNSEIFGSRLPEPRFRLTGARTFRGKLVYRRAGLPGLRRNTDFEMRLSVCFDAPMTEWEDVVIHEMIHLRIAAEGLRDRSAHGPLFRSMMSDINRRHGRSVRISSKSTEKELDSDRRVRGHYLFIALFSDGRLGVAPVAMTRLFELWEMHLSFPEVREICRVGSIDPWFNRFPRVLRPKFYITRIDELLPHLRGALELHRTPQGLRADTPLREIFSLRVPD